MKKGDKVYLVVPFDRPDEVNGIDYIVQARTLAVASEKQLRLDSYFSFNCGLIFDPKKALGRDFYASPREAVDGFVRGLESNMHRKIREAESAKERFAEAHEWAERWRKENV